VCIQQDDDSLFVQPPPIVHRCVNQCDLSTKDGSGQLGLVLRVGFRAERIGFSRAKDVWETNPTLDRGSCGS
jgi:hypothetical protein